MTKHDSDFWETYASQYPFVSQSDADAADKDADLCVPATVYRHNYIPHNADELLTVLRRDKWAIISAERDTASRHRNNAATAALWADLVCLTGVTVIPCAGFYDGQSELSWLALGIDEDDAYRMARKYDQETYLDSHGLAPVGEGMEKPSRGIELLNKLNGNLFDSYSTVYLESGPVSFVMKFEDEELLPEWGPWDYANDLDCDLENQITLEREQLYGD